MLDLLLLLGLSVDGASALWLVGQALILGWPAGTGARATAGVAGARQAPGIRPEEG
jgi:hypothetical protein